MRSVHPVLYLTRCAGHAQEICEKNSLKILLSSHHIGVKNVAGVVSVQGLLLQNNL